MKIHAYDRTIQQIFSPETKYIIPRFQREYSWSLEEVAEFWNDITDNIEETVEGYVNKEYFIGSLVLVEKNEETYLIVDGQQRLTTITVFFSALIQCFVNMDQNGLANGLYKYVEGSDLNSDKFFKLVNENPRPFFQKSIQNITKESLNPDTNEEKRLNDAYEFLVRKLSGLNKVYKSSNEYVKYLVAVRHQLLGLKTIFISVTSMDEAYTIFETLNSKGISLAPTDLIKNDIFKVLTDEHPNDDAKELWKKIQSNTKSSFKDVSINTFIRHYWLSKHEFITEGRLYKAYKKLKLEKTAEMKSFLDELVLESEVYKQISFPNPNDWKQQEEKDIYSSLEALTIFKVTQMKTVLLSLIAQRKRGIVSLAQLKASVQVLENFHFIFTAIASERAAGLESKYSTYARKIRSAKNKGDINEVIKDMTNYLQSKLPSYDKFEKGFLELKFTNTNTSEKKLVKYVFSKFEKDQHHTEELTVSAFSLEHISPQSSKIEEMSMIGNLLPLDKRLNEMAGNKSFVDKMEVFSKSNLLSVKQFVDMYSDKVEWTPEDIVSRSKSFARKAFEDIWNL